MPPASVSPGALIAAPGCMADQIALLLWQAGADHTANSSGAAGSLIWIVVIAIVMVCLLILGIVGLSAGNKTKS